MMKNGLNELIKNYKIFNNNIIVAKKLGISINENNKNQLSEINDLLDKEIKNFYDSQNIKKDKDNSNKDNIINELNNEISKLKEKLSRYPFDLSIGEKLISVNFISLDQNMYYSLICKNTEKFIELEKKIYNEFPEYSKTNNYFMINGNRVNNEQTLDENKIRNNDIIILAQNKI